MNTSKEYVPLHPQAAWHLPTNSGDKGSSSKTARPELPPATTPWALAVPWTDLSAVCPSSHAPGREMSGPNPQQTTVLPWISWSSGMKHFRENKFNSALQCPASSSSSNCKESNHKRPRAQYQTPHILQSGGNLNSNAKKAESYPRAQQGCWANVLSTDAHLLATFRCAGVLPKGD